MNKKTVNIGSETLAYLDEGKGQVVLMLHGNMSSSVHYQPLIERLRDKFRCVVPDLRGFGDSTYNHRFNSIDDLANDVNAFMEALHIDKAYVVGWSTGGGVGLKLAAMYPDKVIKFVSVEGADHKGYPVFIKDEKFRSTGKPYPDKDSLATDPLQVVPPLTMMQKKDAVSMTALWDATIYVVNKPTKEQNDYWMSETLKQRCLVDVDWSLATFNMSDLYTAYGKGDGSIHLVKCPCAFTLGKNDVVVPDWMVLNNYNALKANAVLWPYDNCGHSPMVDCPDRLAADVTDFFN